MNNSAAKVGDIFREAGTAFTKLSEMTLMLQSTDDASPGSKLTEEEVEMLRGCVNSFAVELNKISIHIKDRTITQIRTTLKKKAFEDAGIPIPTRQVSSTVTSHKKPVPRIAPVIRAAPVIRTAPVPRMAPVARVAPVTLSGIHPPPLPPPTALGKNAEVTLNMLNASENEDVDGLGGEVKLEFGSTNDEVAT